MYGRVMNAHKLWNNIKMLDNEKIHPPPKDTKHTIMCIILHTIMDSSTKRNSCPD